MVMASFWFGSVLKQIQILFILYPGNMYINHENMVA